MHTIKPIDPLKIRKEMRHIKMARWWRFHWPLFLLFVTAAAIVVTMLFYFYKAAVR